MKTLFLTGSTGTLGKIIKPMLEARYDVTCFVGDLRDKTTLTKQIPDNTDIVVHLAAMVPVTQVKGNPTKAYEVNVGGTMNLVAVLQEKGILPYFFYACSSHVYAPSNQALTEESETTPSSLYGRTKLMGEDFLRDCYDPQLFCSGRIFSFYHDTQKVPFLYPSIRQRLRDEDLSKPFELYGADSQRDFLNAEDVCKLITQVVHHQATGIINIGSGIPTRVRDFVQGFSPQPLTIDPKGTNDAIIADISKLEAILA